MALPWSRRGVSRYAAPASRSRTRGSYERWIKPVFDRVVAGLLIVILLPLLVSIAVLVRVRLGRPVLLSQPRVGLSGRVFSMFKFRTMEPDRRSDQVPFEGPDRRRCHKTEDDPRHTAVGRFLRRWSLDELPQLVNIAAGHMSLVGPRPELMQIVSGYQPWQHRRHVVKPGVTGLWQITERGSSRLMHECTEVDLEYVEQVSLRTDLEILLRTIPAALGGRRGN